MSQGPRRFKIEDSYFAVVVRRPITIFVATLTVALFGAVSYQRLPLTLMPEMSYPTLTVRTTFPGTAPEEMEGLVARPLEVQLGVIPRLVSLSSASKAGQTDVILEFQWKTDMDIVAQDVREKIDRIRLPDGAQRPLLLYYDPSLDPILRFGLAGPQSLYELRRIAEEDVRRKIEAMPGVAAVLIKGGLEEQYLVAIDEGKLATLKLDIGQVAARLQQVNVNLPVGNVREGETEYVIRTLNEFRSLEDISSVIISRQNGIDVRLRDLATVKYFHEDRAVITRVNGQESVEIEIYKEADANVLVVAAAVREAILGNQEQKSYVAGTDPKINQAAENDPMERRRLIDYVAYQLPPGASIQLLSDQSVFIRNSINEVKENAIAGGIIAIVVLLLFLRNVTQTLIVSACIPISILATFAPMFLGGVSLNIISLGGLALGVGNLVDNAIVILESIFRCREEGDPPVTSIVRGTSEVAMPVIASTLTTVAVFFPIVFVEGVAGQVFGDMALAVVFSQIASLIAALYLIPMLASRAAEFKWGEGKPGPVRRIGGVFRKPIGAISRVIGGGMDWFEAGNNWLQSKYPAVLVFTLRHRFLVLGVSFAVMVASGFFVVPRLGKDLIPQVHQAEFNLNIALSVGTPLERTAEIAGRIDRVVREQPEVAHTALVVGAEQSASTAIDAGEHTGRLTVKMKEGYDAVAEGILIDRVRAQFQSVPALKLEVSYPTLFSLKSPIEIEIRGHDLYLLKRVTGEVASALVARVDGLVDVRSTVQAGHPEIQILYNRERLAEYGLNLREVAEIVKSKVQGRVATQFRKDDQVIDVVVRLREEDRLSLEDLRDIVVNPSGTVPISLSAVAELAIHEGPTEIRRVDQQRSAIVTANTRQTDLASVSREIVAALESVPFPAGFSYVLGGQNTEMKTSLNNLMLAFGLAVFLVYMVMASQFESFVQPLLIMMTVPLAMVGVVWVLWLANIPVTIMVFLGLIILVGIVVNNAIVLIDYINTLRGRGMNKREAIIEAGRARLRPILMTALTTVVGLVPMALGIGEGAEIRTPMAITVIVGLTAATVLTLVVIPTLYYQFTPETLVASADPDNGATVSSPVST